MEEQVEDMELDILDDDDEEEEIMNLKLKYRFEEADLKEEEDVAEENDKGDEEELIEGCWIDPDTGESLRGVEVRIFPDKISYVHGLTVVIPNKRYRDDFDLCPFCLKPWTTDKLHQMSCLPCGHMFGMSCILDWMQDRSSGVCPKCQNGFTLKSVTLLYVTCLRIPAEASIRRFPYSKKGFTAFKQYERDLLTDALKNTPETLKQLDDALERQNNAMKRHIQSLKRMDDTKKGAEVLERQADAEERAKELQRQAEELRCRADAYLEKADAFGQQAKALSQRAKALRQRVDAYTPSIKFFKRNYKDHVKFLRLRDALATM